MSRAQDVGLTQALDALRIVASRVNATVPDLLTRRLSPRQSKLAGPGQCQGLQSSRHPRDRLSFSPVSKVFETAGHLDSRVIVKSVNNVIEVFLGNVLRNDQPDKYDFTDYYDNIMNDIYVDYSFMMHTCQ